jgi:hypothetical protein
VTAARARRLRLRHAVRLAAGMKALFLVRLLV